MPAKFIIVTGGVISGVGKGISTSSIARILQEYGFKVTAIKIDPYINVDAGTLRPTEHGEVWVTDDGGEIDQDLGNYERFLGFTLPKINNITTGQIYKELIDRERRGEFLGQTVEVIPHVPNEIRRRLMKAAEGYDIAVVEVGGTVGDYQNLPYLFAAKGLELELGADQVATVLVTYLPVPGNIGEMKTKPTQQAIRMLNEAGIFPDFVLCRAPEPLDEVRKKKLETNANIKAEHVISAPDVESIYQVPLNFEKEQLGSKLLKRLRLAARKQPDWSGWKALLHNIEEPKHRLKIAIVGKYVDIGNYTLVDSYISIREALAHASAHVAAKAEIVWVDAKEYEKDPKKAGGLRAYAGVIVPGGFGAGGVEGKIAAIRFCRENDIPYLGLCYGMQLAVVEFARNVCKLAKAQTTEVDPKTPHPVIDLQPAQRTVMEQSLYGGTMRLGAYAAVLKEKSQVLELYRQTSRLAEDQVQLRKLEKFRLGVLGDAKAVVLERHRHRYEVNPEYVEALGRHGLIFSGYHERDDGTKLMEYIELPDHPFFVGTQAHPEFRSRLEKPSPLFYGFLRACVDGMKRKKG